MFNIIKHIIQRLYLYRFRVLCIKKTKKLRIRNWKSYIIIHKNQLRSILNEYVVLILVGMSLMLLNTLKILWNVTLSIGTKMVESENVEKTKPYKRMTYENVGLSCAYVDFCYSVPTNRSKHAQCKDRFMHIVLYLCILISKILKTKAK